MSRGLSIFSAFKALPKSMKIALAGSVIFHVGIILLGTVGLPYIKKPIVIPQEPLSVEIVDISEMRTAMKPPQKAPPKQEEKPKPPPKVEKPVEAPPKVEAKEPPKVRPLEKPAEPPAAEEKPPEPDTPPPPKDDKLEKPKPEAKPKEKPKPKEEKVEKTVSEEDFLSVLKNLQDSDTTVEESNEGEGDAKPEASPLAKFAERLSATELDMIARALNMQFASCWNLMAGARYAEDIIVSINLKVNPDRTIQSARIADQWRYNQDSFYRAAADTALRAVRHPNCETLDLPADKYEIWKDLTFNFNPSAQL